MSAPGRLTPSELVALAKQSLGGRNSGLMTDAWYLARINSGYARLTTFQGLVSSPSMRRPQFRVVRFFELYDEYNSHIGQNLTSNFVIPNTNLPIVYVDDVYDLTNDRQLKRKAIRFMNKQNPEDTDTPVRWCPGGRGSKIGYFINPIPGAAADEIDVRERVYRYPTALETTDDKYPVIPGPWHAAIWFAGAAEAAAIIDWPEKSAEMEQRFLSFVAERRSPVEESGAAGGRRHYAIGGI